MLTWQLSILPKFYLSPPAASSISKHTAQPCKLSRKHIDTAETMASTSAVAMAVPPSPSTTGRRLPLAGSSSFFNPLRTAATTRLPRAATGRFEVRASSSVKEQAVAGLTAAAMAAAFLVPDIAEAAQPGISPSLKNFLLSIVSGGIVLTALIGAVIGVSNFDPVKRT